MDISVLLSEHHICSAQVILRINCDGAKWERKATGGELRSELKLTDIFYVTICKNSLLA